MRPSIRIKICGLRRPDEVEAAVGAGADYVGFVFFPPSPRHISAARAGELEKLTGGVQRVALTVDASDQELEDIVRAVDPDMFQLHGNEKPRRVADIRRRFDRPVMKAIGVRSAGDLALASDYDAAADQLLIDAKPDSPDALPGGGGKKFDWDILRDWKPALPWMLAGGLNAENVVMALERTGAEQVDVSSGVEESPGRKSPTRIVAFINAVRRRNHDR
ncbi:MAG: phosphoribosylanthranilate isomerase [Rhodobacteraceae bacterium]|nr:phosphoribosylanthranilate isomerase [Paracoccaceae bacterium]